MLILRLFGLLLLGVGLTTLSITASLFVIELLRYLLATWKKRASVRADSFAESIRHYLNVIQ